MELSGKLIVNRQTSFHITSEVSVLGSSGSPKEWQV